MVFENIAALGIEESFTIPWFLALIIITALWKFTWYGIALWQTIERKKKVHFVIFVVLMMVLNDLGIVPIIYLLVTKKKK